MQAHVHAVRFVRTALGIALLLRCDTLEVTVTQHAHGSHTGTHSRQPQAFRQTQHFSYRTGSHRHMQAGC